MTYNMTISVEMKDREVTGPLLAEIVGKALKDQANVQDIVIICRAVNRGAKRDKAAHEKRHNIRIKFIEK